MIVNQVLDELGISLDHELSEVVPGLEKPHITQVGKVKGLSSTIQCVEVLVWPSSSFICWLWLSVMQLVYRRAISCGSLSLSLSLSFQKQAVAAAGADTDDLQARLDQLRRGDDD